MTDEAPETPDTPELAAPESEGHAASTSDEVVDWRQRYESLRPEFDRRNQELKEAQERAALVDALRSDDPHERLRAAEELGLDYEDPDLYDDTPDPLDQLRAEFSEFKTSVEQERAAAQEEVRREEEAYFAASELKAVGLDPENDEHAKVAQFVLAAAYANRDEQGRPDVRAAFTDYQSILDQHARGVFEAKKNAPHVAAGGQSATQQPPEPGDGAAWHEYLVNKLYGGPTS